MKPIYTFTTSLLLAACFNAYALPATTPNNNKKSDSEYMLMAIELAKHNPKVPFGAVIVDNKTGNVLCRGLNDATSTHNPTHHGEMVAINQCVKDHPAINWKNTTLYTTGEPCAMCQGAIIWAGISRVVFGTSVDNLQHLGWKQIDIPAESLNRKASFYKGTVVGGVMEDDTDGLFVRKKS